MSASSTARHLRDVAEDQVESVASMARSAGETVGTYAAEATEMARHAADTVKHAASEARDRTVSGVHQLQDTIAHRPLTGALVAAGIGFLVGAAMMMTRRR